MTSNNDEQASRAPMAASRPPVIVISQVFYYQMAPIFVTPPPASPAPPPKTKNPFKTRSTEEPYIKKPLNAFMIFMKEQRPFVKAKMLNKDSATVNKVIGELWQSLTQEEQLKYYQESDRLRRIHDRMYPNWTCRSNYGRKKKRIWGKAATGSNDQTRSAPEPPTHTDILHEGHDTGLTSPSSELEASSSSSSSYAAESHRKDTASATATYAPVPPTHSPPSSPLGLTIHLDT